jgi:hypothetical protein
LPQPGSFAAAPLLFELPDIFPAKGLAVPNHGILHRFTIAGTANGCIDAFPSPVFSYDVTAQQRGSFRPLATFVTRSRRRYEVSA